MGPPGTETRDERLVVASRPSSRLAGAHTADDAAAIAVGRLHGSFAFCLAVVQRPDPDRTLRVVAGGRLGSQHPVRSRDRDRAGRRARPIRLSSRFLSLGDKKDEIKVGR